MGGFRRRVRVNMDIVTHTPKWQYSREQLASTNKIAHTTHIIPYVAAAHTHRHHHHVLCTMHVVGPE